MCQEMITTVYKVITAHRGNIYSALDGLFAHRTGANYPMRERERQRERERDGEVDSLRNADYNQASARSLGVKDIPSKNVNGAKATGAILHQIPCTAGKEPVQRKVGKGTEEGGNCSVIRREKSELDFRGTNKNGFQGSRRRESDQERQEEIKSHKD